MEKLLQQPRDAAGPKKSGPVSLVTAIGRLVSLKLCFNPGHQSTCTYVHPA